MKILNNVFLSILITSIYVNINAQEQPFNINGKFSESLLAEKVFIQYYDKGTMVKDSAVINEGKFSLNGNIETPIKARFIVPTFDKSKSTAEFFIEPGQTTDILINKTPKEATITGGSVQKDFSELSNLLAAHDQKYQNTVDEYMKLRDSKDEAGMKKLETVFDDLSKLKKQVLHSFIKQKPESYVSFSSLLDISYMIDDDFLAMYALISDSHKNSKKGQELNTQIEKTKKTFVGQTIQSFTQKDTSNADFSIQMLRGKYVLVDFWASWCGPCRKENPNIVKAYQNFKDRNFEILGVSLDNKRDPWIAAIHKDQLTWYHVSDLKGWKNEVSEMFGIRSIPQNLLINPEGVIIARNITGHELEETLSKYLKGM